MASDQFTNRMRVLMKSESTYGTDAVDAALQDGDEDLIYADVDACDVDNKKVPIIPNRQRASNAGVAHKMVGDRAEVTVTQALTGKAASGAGNEEPHYAPLLKAMGFGVTVVSGTSAAYKPQTVQGASMSIYKWSRNTSDANWRLEYSTGVRGTGTFTFEALQEGKLAFNGVGIFTDTISAAAAFFNSDGEAALLNDASTAVTARSAGTESQSNKSILGCQGMTVTHGGNVLPVQSIEIVMNRSVTAKTTMNGSTSAVSQVFLSVADGTRIEGSFNLQDSGAAFDVIDAAMNGDTEAALAISYGDGTDTIAVAAPKCQIGVYSKSSNAENRTYEVPFYLNGDWSSLAADNDLTITYT